MENGGGPKGRYKKNFEMEFFQNDRGAYNLQSLQELQELELQMSGLY